MAHKWVDALRRPYPLGGPQHFRPGDKIRYGPQAGGLARSAMPSKASPTLHNGGQNEHLPTGGQLGYVIPTV